MTIKVYKKRTHWYYTYHCVEYDLGKLKYLDFLSQLLDSKIIYFIASENSDGKPIGKIQYDCFTNMNYLNGWPIVDLIQWNVGEQVYPNISLHKVYQSSIYLYYKSCIK